jgi:hypothetical protein
MKVSDAVEIDAGSRSSGNGGVDLQGLALAGLGPALAGMLALAGLRVGFSRFTLFQEISARAVRRFGRNLEEKIVDCERNKRNWG